MKPVKVWKIEFCDYIDVAEATDIWMSEHRIDEFFGMDEEYDDIEMAQYNKFRELMKQTKYVEGKTRQGVISNLKNILYNVHLEIINAVPVM